jgi:hypothetical protein
MKLASSASKELLSRKEVAATAIAVIYYGLWTEQFLQHCHVLSDWAQDFD